MLDTPTRTRRRSSAHFTAPRPTRSHPRPHRDLPAPLSDLRRLEAHCHASTERCAALEHSLARLEHDLSARISHWDAQLSSLQSVDDRARALTAQLTAQFAALRGAATPQVASAKAAVVESARRVDESDELLGRSAASIEQARETLDELQRVFKQNQATLERAQSWESWFSWFAIVAAAVCVALLAWFVPRFTGGDGPVS